MSKKGVVDNIIKASQGLVDNIFDIYSDEMENAHSILGKITAYADFLVQAVDITIAYVEKVSEYFKTATGEPLAPEDKLDIAATILDDAIKLPLPLEMFDKTIIKVILSYVVKKYNRDIGHGWIEKVWGNVVSDVEPYLKTVHTVIDKIQQNIGG